MYRESPAWARVGVTKENAAQDHGRETRFICRSPLDHLSHLIDTYLPFLFTSPAVADSARLQPLATAGANSARLQR